MTKRFGENTLDEYSVARVHDEVSFSLRTKRITTGKELRTYFDERRTLIEGMECKYVYSLILEKGDTTESHYHERRQEIIYCISGLVGVKLYTDGWFSMHNLEANTHDALLIKPEAIHRLAAKTEKAVILVIASAPPFEEDDIRAEFPPEFKYLAKP